MMTANGNSEGEPTPLVSSCATNTHHHHHHRYQAPVTQGNYHRYHSSSNNNNNQSAASIASELMNHPESIPTVVSAKAVHRGRGDQSTNSSLSTDDSGGTVWYCAPTTTTGNYHEPTNQMMTPTTAGTMIEYNGVEYLAQLLRDKRSLYSIPKLFTHVERLLDQEINDVRNRLFNVQPSEVADLPAPDGDIVSITDKIYIPIKDYPDFNFVGRLLGPRGRTAKQLEGDTGCKIMIRGRGSMRDKNKEEWMRNKPNWEHLSDDLHVLISCEDYENRAPIRLQIASDKVRQLLIPQPEGEDQLKKKQLMELAILNGTYRECCPAVNGGNSPQSSKYANPSSSPLKQFNAAVPTGLAALYNHPMSAGIIPAANAAMGHSQLLSTNRHATFYKLHDVPVASQWKPDVMFQNGSFNNALTLLSPSGYLPCTFLNGEFDSDQVAVNHSAALSMPTMPANSFIVAPMITTACPIGLGQATHPFMNPSVAAAAGAVPGHPIGQLYHLPAALQPQSLLKRHESMSADASTAHQHYDGGRQNNELMDNGQHVVVDMDHQHMSGAKHVISSVGTAVVGGSGASNASIAHCSPLLHAAIADQTVLTATGGAPGTLDRHLACHHNNNVVRLSSPGGSAFIASLASTPPPPPSFPESWQLAYCQMSAGADGPRRKRGRRQSTMGRRRVRRALHPYKRQATDHVQPSSACGLFNPHHPRH